MIKAAKPLIRNAALEEAARILDEEGKKRFEDWRNPAEIAAAIRALKT